MNELDRTRLLDMLDEARSLRLALMGKTRSDLDDYLTANGVRHAIALIGEAASQVTTLIDQLESIFPDNDSLDSL